MKKKFLLIFSLTIFSFFAKAQKHISRQSLDLLQKTITANPLLQDDEDFKMNSNNDSRWQNESAIIISQKTSFSFDKQGVSAGKVVGRNLLGILLAPVTLGTSLYMANAYNKNQILVQESERRKILLRDNFAIDQYSVLYFRLAGEGDAFAARVIKKNGSLQQINPSEAIAVSDDNSIPSIYTSYTDPDLSRSYNPPYYKIPVADLEPGDMIEYEFTHLNTQTYYHNPDYKEFEPVYYLCNRELPVARQSIEVISENDNYYIACKSLKGAPSFTTADKNGRKIYKWTDDQYREKNKKSSYTNQFLEMPLVKFQVLYAKNSSRDFLWFDNEEAMKNDLSDNALAEQAKTLWFHPGKATNTGSYMDGVNGSTDDNVKALYKILKKHGVTDAADDEYVQKAYYTIRSMTMNERWGDYAYAKILSGLLDEKKIAHEVVVTPYNTRTNIQNLAFSNELAWLIKYNNKYLVNPEDHLNPGELPFYLAGNDCISFPYDKEKAAFVKAAIPAGTAEENSFVINIKATLETTKKQDVSVDKTTEAKNLSKGSVIDDALAYTPYMESDCRNYDGESMWEGLDARTADARIGQFNKIKKDWKEKDKPAYMKSLEEEDLGYEVSSFDNFQVQSDGRSYKKQQLVYNEKFTVANVSSFAGEDIVIGLPSFIGGQTRIEKEEQQPRSYSISVRYPRKINWHIEMPVPAGYTAAGLENLHKSVNNNCAEFTSVAKLQNNTVIIDVTKTYKAANFKAEEWQQLLDMLNAAYDFSKAKIVFIKQ